MNNYRVLLVQAGEDRPEVVKTILLLFDMKFEQAVKLTTEGSVPNIIYETTDQESAQIAQVLLQKSGAQIQIQETVSDTTEEISASRYAVVLVDPGDYKIQVIKAIRSLLTMDLMEAKKIVDAAPGSIVLETDDVDKANSSARSLAVSGTELEIQDRITKECKSIHPDPMPLQVKNVYSSAGKPLIGEDGEIHRLSRIQAANAYNGARKETVKVSAPENVERIPKTAVEKTAILMETTGKSSLIKNSSLREKLRKWFFGFPEH